MKHSPSFLILRQTLLRQTYLRIQCMIDFNEIAYQLVISVLQCFACAVYFASQSYIIFINLKLKEECNKTFCLFLCLFFCSQLCYAIFHILKKDWKLKNCHFVLFAFVSVSLLFFVFCCSSASSPCILWLPTGFKNLKIDWNISNTRRVSLKLQSRNNFYSFYPFEFKPYRMVELCTPNNRMFFVFRKWRQMIDSKIKSSISDVNNRWLLKNLPRRKHMWTIF